MLHTEKPYQCSSNVGSVLSIKYMHSLEFTSMSR